jgi:hypothetical protein
MRGISIEEVIILKYILHKLCLTVMDGVADCCRHGIATLGPTKVGNLCTAYTTTSLLVRTVLCEVRLILFHGHNLREGPYTYALEDCISLASSHRCRF